MLSLTTQVHKTALLASLYISRGIIGIGVGITGTAAWALASLWFGKPNHSSTSGIVLVMVIDAGVLLARYFIVSIYDINESLYQAFLLPICVSFVVTIGTMTLDINEKAFEKQLVLKYSSTQDDINIGININTNTDNTDIGNNTIKSGNKIINVVDIADIHKEILYSGAKYNKIDQLSLETWFILI